MSELVWNASLGLGIVCYVWSAVNGIGSKPTWIQLGLGAFFLCAWAIGSRLSVLDGSLTARWDLVGGILFVTLFLGVLWLPWQTMTPQDVNKTKEDRGQFRAEAKGGMNEDSK